MSPSHVEAGARAKVGQSWARRANGELSTANLASLVAHVLFEDGASAEVLRLAANAVSDELRHAQICQRLAEEYLGVRLPAPRARHVELPRFGAAPDALNRLLFVVYHSCVSEGIACAFLQENLRLAEAPAVRAALHELLRDDLQHARLGWAHLASRSADASAYAHVAAALPVLLELATRAWLAREDGDDFDSPREGVLAHVRFAPIVQDALENLILPGFDHVGVATERARAWLATEPALG